MGYPLVSQAQHVNIESAAKIISALYIGYAIGGPSIGLLRNATAVILLFWLFVV